MAIAEDVRIKAKFETDAQNLNQVSKEVGKAIKDGVAKLPENKKIGKEVGKAIGEGIKTQLQAKSPADVRKALKDMSEKGYYRGYRRTYKEGDYEKWWAEALANRDAEAKEKVIKNISSLYNGQNFKWASVKAGDYINGSLGIGQKGFYTQEMVNQMFKQTLGDTSKPYQMSDVATESFADLEEAFSGISDYVKNNSTPIMEALGKITSAFRDLGKGVKESLKPLKVFIGRIGRITIYRMIRAAIKAVADAFREGRDNLYQWSKLQSSSFGNSFAKALDRIATATMYLKNAIATVTAPVIEAFSYLLDQLVDKMASALEAMSKFMGYLTGSGYYLKATKYNLAYADSVKAVQNAIMGFDELNVLNSNSSTSSIQDYTDLFENIALEATDNYATNLRLSIQDIFFNSDDITAESVAQKLCAGLGALTGTLIGWTVGGLGGALLGMTVGASIGTLISALTFNNDGTLGAEELGALIWAGLGGLVGGVLGFTYLGIVMGKGKGTVMGFSVGAAIGMLIYDTTFGAGTGKQDANTFTTLLRYGLLPIIGGVLGCIIAANPVAGALLGITIGVALTMAIQSVDWTGLATEIKSNSSALSDWKVDLFTNVVDAVESKKISTTTSDWLKNLHKNSLNQYLFANGGTPDVGSLFWAGENGAELVTQVGGRNTVYNEEQLGNSLAYANESVVNAILSSASSIMNSIAENKTVVSIGDREIARAATRGNKLTGSSLIQGA